MAAWPCRLPEQDGRSAEVRADSIENQADAVREQGEVRADALEERADSLDTRTDGVDTAAENASRGRRFGSRGNRAGRGFAGKQGGCRKGRCEVSASLARASDEDKACRLHLHRGRLACGRLTPPQTAPCRKGVASVTADHGKDLSRDVAGHLRGGKEHIGGGNLFGLRRSPHGRAAAELPNVRGLLVCGIQWRPYGPGRHGVDADAAFDQLRGQRTGPRMDGAFGPSRSPEDAGCRKFPLRPELMMALPGGRLGSAARVSWYMPCRLVCTVRSKCAGVRSRGSGMQLRTPRC